jgi:hypothetical protein
MISKSTIRIGRALKATAILWTIALIAVAATLEALLATRRRRIVPSRLTASEQLLDHNSTADLPAPRPSAT